MSALKHISAPPVFAESETQASQSRSTSTSPASAPPRLSFKLANATAYLTPSPTDLPSCFSALQPQIQTSSMATDETDDEDESASTAAVSKANVELYLTEAELVLFSPQAGTGITLSYLTIALHAVTRSPPAFLVSSNHAESSASASASDGTFPGCLYCQLDLSAENGQEDEEDEGNFLEMYIVTPDESTLDQLFEALSQCASLHPSGGADEDETSSHPFAGFAPFGTGANGHGQNGAFDDADAGEADDFVSDVATQSDGVDQELSETGRRNMVHLESIMQWPSDDEQGDNRAESSSRVSTPDLVREPRATNTLILSNLPVEFFTPQICSLLLSLLNTYGPMVRWTPMPTVGRALVIFQDASGAALAKAGLDRLLLPFEDAEVADPGASTGDGDAMVQRGVRDQDEDDGPMLRAIFGPATDPNSEPETLAVPTTDKNFLISPPGSPPVGWEPIREDPPNRDTLAEDLMRALADLRDTGSHIASHQPKEWGADAEPGLGDSVKEEQLKTRSPGAPEVILAPSVAPPMRAFRPAWLRNDKDAQDEEGAEETQLPGVTVQSFDGDEDDADQGGAKLFNGFSISSVKATVDSMRGPIHVPSDPNGETGLGAGLGLGSEGRRITPTGRPPLNNEAFGRQQ
ncbi:Calcipressin-domain-containing protein [Testicularia cyperi]|uniref:Calcipressin-domain-containing protein n=1 Tax=Testicularia cyperi TaxID=1882483 RepID=A0A317XWV8_9BASI|nr:Calcipressin-domain-containing protein [Testicularia cyperi]